MTCCGAGGGANGLGVVAVAVCILLCTVVCADMTVEEVGANGFFFAFTANGFCMGKNGLVPAPPPKDGTSVLNVLRFGVISNGFLIGAPKGAGGFGHCCLFGLVFGAKGLVIGVFVGRKAFFVVCGEMVVIFAVVGSREGREVFAF